MVTASHAWFNVRHAAMKRAAKVVSRIIISLRTIAFESAHRTLLRVRKKQFSPLIRRNHGLGIWISVSQSISIIYFLFLKNCNLLVEGECFLCDVSCLTCDGPANNNCLSCHPNFQLSQSQKTCNNECESDEYLDEGVCRKCHPTCLTCFNGSENGCLSCPEGKVLDPHNMACLDSCPPYHFVNSQKICDPCKSEC